MMFVIVQISIKLLLSLILIERTNGVVPQGTIKLINHSKDILCSVASFSEELLPQTQTSPNFLLRPPTLDGCSTSQLYNSFDKSLNYIWLAERGNCSFYQKAKSAYSVGANGIVVYNSLKAIYKNQNFANSVDYECKYGQGYVKDITYPVWGEDMTQNMPNSCTHDSKCASQRCVLTNRTTTLGHEVCCVFDLYVGMGGGSPHSIPIPTVFIRMKDYDTLLTYEKELNINILSIMLSKRYEPAINLSSLLIWMLAVMTVAIGSIRAVSSKSPFSPPNVSPPTNVRQDRNSSGSNLAVQDFNSIRKGQVDDQLTYFPEPRHTTPTAVIAPSTISEFTNSNNESLNFEITPLKAILWVLFSSCILLLLFYIDLSYAIIALYLLASSVTSSVTIFMPLFQWPPLHSLLMKLISNQFAVSRVLPGVCSGLLCLFWISCRIYSTASTSSRIWLPQDVLGFSVCVFGISMVKLPNLKVAVLLLWLMFAYDVFFVFITPYIFSSSIMMKVASGRNSGIRHEENYCEKYPDATDCQSTSMPMLLMVPSIYSYSSTGAMLGLGDIVLPGLLLALTARVDSHLFGHFHPPVTGRTGSPLRQRRGNQSYLFGCFGIALLGYALGLMLANMAVSFFETGQPALLYIVPLTTGFVALWSHYHNCFQDLWTGALFLKSPYEIGGGYHGVTTTTATTATASSSRLSPYTFHDCGEDQHLLGGVGISLPQATATTTTKTLPTVDPNDNYTMESVAPPLMAYRV